MDQTYRIFTDGSAIGNPGPGGWGAVVMQGKERWEMSGAHPWTTISEMELVAAVQALRSVPGRARDRTALGLGIPDLWNARLRLPLAAPGLAKSARNPTAAPRIVGGADRVECPASHPLDVDQRSQRASRPEPRRRAGVSGRPHSLGATEGSGLMPAKNSERSRRRNTDGIDCGSKLAV